MTDQIDDLEDLKVSFAAVTPPADAERRAQNIAMSLAQFERQNAAQAQNQGVIARIKGVFRRQHWAGFATGATAVIALGVLVLPDQAEVTPPKITPPIAQDAPMMLADESVAMAETLSAPLSAPQSFGAEMDAAPALSRAAVAPSLADLRAALTSLTRQAPEVPPTQYALPWETDRGLSDTGVAGDSERFAIAPLTISNRRAVPDAVTFIIALRGFIAVIDEDQTETDWGMAEAIAMAARSARSPQEMQTLALMRSFAEQNPRLAPLPSE